MTLQPSSTTAEGIAAPELSPDPRPSDPPTLSSHIKKLFLFIVLLALTGIPILRLSSFFALGGVTLLLLAGRTRSGRTRLIFVALTALGCIGAACLDDEPVASRRGDRAGNEGRTLVEWHKQGA